MQDNEWGNNKKAVPFVFLSLSPTVTGVSLMRICYNAVDEYVNAACMTQTFPYASWLLCELSDKCENMASNFITVVIISLFL
jgi:hypothetical protein